MDDVKEKIVRLLADYIGCDHYDAIADYLIANDVVPVVRCKDCLMEQVCTIAQWLGEDGFCSDGERREGE